MIKEIRYKYTPEAERHLIKAKHKYQKEIQNYIKEYKYVPGDRFIEITSSDVEKAISRTKIIKVRRDETIKMVSNIYTIIGILMIIIGLFYTQFKMLLVDNPIQLVMVLTGTIFIMVSFLFSYYMRVKMRKYYNEKTYEDIYGIRFKRR